MRERGNERMRQGENEKTFYVAGYLLMYHDIIGNRILFESFELMSLSGKFRILDGEDPAIYKKITLLQLKHICS